MPQGEKVPKKYFCKIERDRERNRERVSEREREGERERGRESVWVREREK